MLNVPLGVGEFVVGVEVFQFEKPCCSDGDITLSIGVTFLHRDQTHGGTHGPKLAFMAERDPKLCHLHVFKFIEQALKTRFEHMDSHHFSGQREHF